MKARSKVLVIVLLICVLVPIATVSVFASQNAAYKITGSIIYTAPPKIPITINCSEQIFNVNDFETSTIINFVGIIMYPETIASPEPSYGEGTFKLPPLILQYSSSQKSANGLYKFNITNNSDSDIQFTYELFIIVDASVSIRFKDNLLQDEKTLEIEAGEKAEFKCSFTFSNKSEIYEEISIQFEFVKHS